MGKLVLIIVFLLPNVSLAQFDWKLVSDRDGIKIYKARNHPSPIFPIKGETTVNYSIEEIIAVLLDIDRKKQWIKRIKKAEILEKNSFFSRVEYYHMGVPIIKDRDLVYRVEVEVINSGRSVVLKCKSLPEPQRPFTNHVRACLKYGMTRLSYIDKSKTKIESEAIFDPKGNIPAWIINLFSAKVTRISVERMIEQFSKNLYSEEQLLEISRIITSYQEETESPRTH